MEVNSKFRVLFLIRKNIIFFLFAGLCLWMLISGIFESVSGLISAAIIFLAICALVQLINLHSVFKIIISENGIIKISFISGERELIPFSSIINIIMQRVDGLSTSDAGQITTGYYESLITLKNNRKLTISPDHFENYEELIRAIKKNMGKVD